MDEEDYTYLEKLRQEAEDNAHSEECNAFLEDVAKMKYYDVEAAIKQLDKELRRPLWELSILRKALKAKYVEEKRYLKSIENFYASIYDFMTDDGDRKVPFKPQYVRGGYRFTCPICGGFRSSHCYATLRDFEDACNEDMSDHRRIIDTIKIKLKYSVDKWKEDYNIQIDPEKVEFLSYNVLRYETDISDTDIQIEFMIKVNDGDPIKINYYCWAQNADNVEIADGDDGIYIETEE